MPILHWIATVFCSKHIVYLTYGCNIIYFILFYTCSRIFFTRAKHACSQTWRLGKSMYMVIAFNVTQATTSALEICVKSAFHLTPIVREMWGWNASIKGNYILSFISLILKILYFSIYYSFFNCTLNFNRN